MASVVVGDERALTHRAFVEGLDLASGGFDPAETERRWRACRSSTAVYEWTFDPAVLQRFDTERLDDASAVARAVGAEEEAK